MCGQGSLNHDVKSPMGADLLSTKLASEPSQSKGKEGWETEAWVDSASPKSKGASGSGKVQASGHLALRLICSSWHSV